MSDKIKITELTTLDFVEESDWTIVVDISDLSQGPQGTTKKVRKDRLKGLNWRGLWTDSELYYKDEAVELNGSAYIARVNTISSPPGGDWDLLVAKGATGAPGASVVIQVPSQTVDGVNVTFTFTSLPLYIFSDGVALRSTLKNGSVAWSAVGLTITMVNAPTFDIYAVLSA